MLTQEEAFERFRAFLVPIIRKWRSYHRRHRIGATTLPRCTYCWVNITFGSPACYECRSLRVRDFERFCVQNDLCGLCEGFLDGAWDCPECHPKFASITCDICNKTVTSTPYPYRNVCSPACNWIKLTRDEDLLSE